MTPTPATPDAASEAAPEAALEAALAPHLLEVLGGFNPDPGAPGLPAGTRALVLLGPREPGFWAHLTAQPEWDGAPDPVDRWSRRAIDAIARELGATPLYPFGGPPWHPFFEWALRSGRAWQSPVRLLVHDRQGLMVSFRGALALASHLELPRGTNPCTGCPAPCLTACPAGALGQGGYDLAACHAFLDTPAGQQCMQGGCLVRRACPVSQRYGRTAAQSAYHMRQFHR